MSNDIVFGIRLKADGKEFTGEMRASEAEVRKFSGAADRAARSADEMGRSIGGAARAAAGLAGLALGTGLVTQLAAAADASTNLASRLRLVTDNQVALAAAQTQVFEIAQRSRAELAATGDLYSRIAKSAEGLGVSQGRVAQLTETVAQTMAISGASAGAASSAILQFGQALSSGVLRGDEFNSVMEQAPALIEAIALGMGRTVGEMRVLAEEGALTAEAIVAALEKQAPAVARQFEQIAPTLSAGWQQISNAALAYVGRVDQASGASTGLAQALGVLAAHIDTVAASAALLGSVVLGALAARALTAAGGVAQLGVANLTARTGVDALSASLGVQAASLTAGQLAARAASGAMGLLGGPIGLVTTALAAGVTAWTLWGASAESAGDRAAAALREVQQEALRTGATELEVARGKLAQAQAKYSEGSMSASAPERSEFVKYQAMVQQLEAREARIAERLASLAAHGSEGWGKLYQTQLQKRGEALAALDQSYAEETRRAAGNQEAQLRLAREYQQKRAALEKQFADKPAAKSKAVDAEKAFHDAILKTHDAAMKAAEDEAATLRALEEQQQQHTRAVEDHMRPLEERAAALERERDTYGRSATEIERTVLARIEEARAIAAANGANQDHLDFLDREIAARRRIVEAASGKELLEAEDKAAKAGAEAAERRAGNLEAAFFDAIVSGGVSAGEALEREFKALVLEPIVRPVAQMGANAVLSMFGMTGGSGGGSGGGGGNLLGSLGMFGAGLGAFGTGLGAAGAAVSAVGLGGTLSAAGSLIGTGTAAGAGAGAGMALGSVAPYALAAYAILDAAGVFKGPTPHRGGAAFAGTDGSFGQATAANTPDFGLGWGAYRSDRSAALDASVSTLARGVSDTIASLLDTLGAATGEMTVLARFAADNDDASVGALRILSDTGEVLADLSKKYSKDGAKGFQQFAEDSSRAILAALQAAEGIDPVVAKMLGAVDPMKAAITDVTATLTRAADWIAAGKQLEDAIYQAFTPPADMLADVFEGLSTAIPDSAAAFEALTRAQNLNTEAGRAAAAQLLQVYPLWQRVTEESERAAEAAATAAEQRRAEEERAQQQQAERNAAIWERTRERTENAAKAMRGFIDELSAFRRELTSGALAGLSPEAAYRAAQANFDRVSREAQLGNPASIDKLDEVSRALLEASQAYYAGSAGYFADRDRVLGAVDATLGVAARQSGISVPRFAEGGLHAGGLRLVGERGPELEITGPARYLNATDTRAALAGNGNREVVTELRAVVRVLGDGLSTLIEQGESHDARLATLERGARLGAARPRAAA